MRESAEESRDSDPARAELVGVSPGDLVTRRLGRVGIGLQSTGPSGALATGRKGRAGGGLHSCMPALTLVASIEGLLR
jgi:hypothetical protein